MNCVQGNYIPAQGEDWGVYMASSIPLRLSAFKQAVTVVWHQFKLVSNRLKRLVPG